jgi:hypothetical protein
MPSIRKLTPDEIKSREERKMSMRKRVAREYDEMLADFDTGDWGEVSIEPDDNRMTVRSRLQAAAGRKGIALTFQRTQGPQLRFRVIERALTEDLAASSAPESALEETPALAPPRKRPGRKPKAATV